MVKKIVIFLYVILPLSWLIAFSTLNMKLEITNDTDSNILIESITASCKSSVYMKKERVISHGTTIFNDIPACYFASIDMYFNNTRVCNKVFLGEGGSRLRKIELSQDSLVDSCDDL